MIHRDDALHYARFGMRATDGGALVWKFDPRLRIRGPWPWMELLMLPFLDAIAAPTLALDGSKGFSSDAEARRRRLAHIRNARHHVVEGAGHHVHLDAPDEVAAEIRKLLAAAPTP